MKLSFVPVFRLYHPYMCYLPCICDPFQTDWFLWNILPKAVDFKRIADRRIEIKRSDEKISCQGSTIKAS